MTRATLLAIGLLAIVSSPARAGDHPQMLPGWEPAPFESFTLPAGTYCPFALHVDVLRNDAIVATTKTAADGSPAQQVFMGPQLLRFSNEDTGASTVTRLDGILVYDFADDGSFTVTALGKNAAPFRIGIDEFPPGFYFIDGYHVVHFPANGGPRQMVSAIGVEINYCQTLSRHHP